MGKLLKYIFNGDWRGSEVQHFCPPGCCSFGRQQTIEKFESELLPLMFSCSLPLWPRHRWMGSDRALDWSGLTLPVHNLLLYVAIAWAKCMKEKRDPVRTDSELFESGVGFLVAAVPLDVPEEVEAPVVERVPARVGVQQQHVVHEANLQIVLAADAPRVATIDWAEVNAKCRVDAIEWVSSRPWPRIIIMSVCMEPFRRLFLKLVALGGEVCLGT